VRRKAVTGGGDREEGKKTGIQRKGEKGSEEEREVKQVFGGGEGRR